MNLKERVSKMDTLEKKITLGIDVKDKHFNHKAKYAIAFLKKEFKKHFRNKEVIISPAINEFIWNKGRVNAPNKISLVSVEKNNKIYLFLDSPDDLKRKDAFLSGKKETEEKKQSAKEQKKEKESQEKSQEENKEKISKKSEEHTKSSKKNLKNK